MQWTQRNTMWRNAIHADTSQTFSILQTLPFCSPTYPLVHLSAWLPHTHPSTETYGRPGGGKPPGSLASLRQSDQWCWCKPAWSQNRRWHGVGPAWPRRSHSWSTTCRSLGRGCPMSPPPSGSRCPLASLTVLLQVGPQSLSALEPKYQMNLFSQVHLREIAVMSKHCNKVAPLMDMPKLQCKRAAVWGPPLLGIIMLPQTPDPGYFHPYISMNTQAKDHPYISPNTTPVFPQTPGPRTTTIFPQTPGPPLYFPKHQAQWPPLYFHNRRTKEDPNISPNTRHTPTFPQTPGTPLYFPKHQTQGPPLYFHNTRPKDHPYISPNTRPKDHPCISVNTRPKDHPCISVNTRPRTTPVFL